MGVAPTAAAGLPEAPYAALLPLAAIGALGVLTAVRRGRRVGALD